MDGNVANNEDLGSWAFKKELDIIEDIFARPAHSGALNGLARSWERKRRIVAYLVRMGIGLIDENIRDEVYLRKRNLQAAFMI